MDEATDFGICGRSLELLAGPSDRSGQEDAGQVIQERGGRAGRTRLPRAMPTAASASRNASPVCGLAVPRRAARPAVPGSARSRTPSPRRREAASAVASAMYGQFGAADDLGQDAAEAELPPQPAADRTPPREIRALVRKLRQVDFAARHLGGRP